MEGCGLTTSTYVIMYLRIIVLLSLLLLVGFDTTHDISFTYLKNVCSLLGVNHTQIKPPTIAWSRDTDELNRISGVNKLEWEVHGFYNPCTNTIFLSPSTYSPEVLYHELTHAVLTQVGYSLVGQEPVCNEVERHARLGRTTKADRSLIRLLEKLPKQGKSGGGGSPKAGK